MDRGFDLPPPFCAEDQIGCLCKSRAPTGGPGGLKIRVSSRGVVRRRAENGEEKRGLLTRPAARPLTQADNRIYCLPGGRTAAQEKKNNERKAEKERKIYRFSRKKTRQARKTMSSSIGSRRDEREQRSDARANAHSFRPLSLSHALQFPGSDGAAGGGGEKGLRTAKTPRDTRCQ